MRRAILTVLLAGVLVTAPTRGVKAQGTAPARVQSQDGAPTWNYKGTPFTDRVRPAGPRQVPGIVYCAYYDRGGEGVAYHDSDAKNNGSGALNPADGSYLNEFRKDEGVDISYTKTKDDTDTSPYNKA